MSNKNDIYWQIATLHISNLDQSFLASLGPTFLSEVYRAMDRSESAALLYETIDGNIVGFISGGTSMKPIYQTMFKRSTRWGFALAIKLLSPSRLKKVIDILRYGQKHDDSLPDAELFSIAIAPSARGTGVAKKLYGRLNHAFKAQGIDCFHIIVGEDLTAAHKFYLKMGARVVSELELHACQKSKVYVSEVGRYPPEH